MTANLEAVPDRLQSILKVSFLDRYGNEIKQMIEKDTHMTFVYPHEAYTYHISLLSAGMVKELDF
ncbi:MAG: accessory Sec system protein Asp3 [Streptococcus salivarius]